MPWALNPDSLWVAQSHAGWTLDLLFPLSLCPESISVIWNSLVSWNFSNARWLTHSRLQFVSEQVDFSGLYWRSSGDWHVISCLLDFPDKTSQPFSVHGHPGSDFGKGCLINMYRRRICYLHPTSDWFPFSRQFWSTYIQKEIRTPSQACDQVGLTQT